MSVTLSASISWWNRMSRAAALSTEHSSGGQWENVHFSVTDGHLDCYARSQSGSLRLLESPREDGVTISGVGSWALPAARLAALIKTFSARSTLTLMFDSDTKKVNLSSDDSVDGSYTLPACAYRPNLVRHHRIVRTSWSMSAREFSQAVSAGSSFVMTTLRMSNDPFAAVYLFVEGDSLTTFSLSHSGIEFSVAIVRDGEDTQRYVGAFVPQLLSPRLAVFADHDTLECSLFDDGSLTVRCDSLELDIPGYMVSGDPSSYYESFRSTCEQIARDTALRGVVSGNHLIRITHQASTVSADRMTCHMERSHLHWTAHGTSASCRSTMPVTWNDGGGEDVSFQIERSYMAILAPYMKGEDVEFSLALNAVSPYAITVSFSADTRRCVAVLSLPTD